MAEAIRSSMRQIVPVCLARLVAVTGLPAERVNPWVGDAEAPHLQADQDLVLRLGGWSPDRGWFVGGGRSSLRLVERFEVQLRTRLALDPAGSAYVWLTDTTLGHLQLRNLVLDALVEFLPADTSGNVLVTDPLALVPAPKPRTDARGGQPVSWGSETLTFEVAYLQALDQSLRVTP